MIYQLIVFGPLFAAIFAGLFHRVVGDRIAMIVTTGVLVLSAVLSWVVFLEGLGGSFGGGAAHAASEGAHAMVGAFGDSLRVEVARWIVSGDPAAEGSFVVDWAFRIDALTRVMLIVITTVSALVHLYSFGYMEDDRTKGRFFAYLSFFTFSMLMLVTADNFLQLFFGWEGVGVASYLLIGYYWKKPSAGSAAIKAFVVNRVGDFGLALGVMGIFLVFGSVDFETVFAAAPQLVGQTISFIGLELDILTLLTFLLFIGAMGKSAQLFLHTWLPDAMEGPTPVSALIHAATMVTAGVFLVCRASPLFELAPDTMWFITVIGASTAFFAATVGLVQHDIKRVIAYSTCSQLGYMFFAAGVGAYEAAMFHLLTHAFFKALLFLGAGSVIHGMHHEQDMRNYGGLYQKMPITAIMMLIGTLAITGVGIPTMYIGFAGFYSKDIIIEAAYASPSSAGIFAFWIGVIAAAMTSFYSWRLWFKTFLGAPRGDAHTHAHAHESPMVMLIPLYVLAAGAVFSGAVFYAAMVGDGEAGFWGGSIFTSAENTVLHDAHYVPTWVKVSPFIAMLLGLIGAWIFYIRSPWIPDALAARHTGLHAFLLNKWYFDELYDAIFVRPAFWIGRLLWRRGDGAVIDGTINGLALGAAPAVSAATRRAQSGYIFRYASVMIIGIAIIVSYILFGGLS
ncbi:MAG: NADH-quinone oxidoreductase subunit L [Pseudomonadota bacterium]